MRRLCVLYFLAYRYLKTTQASCVKRRWSFPALMRHRGPDWSGVYASDRQAILAHERLSIVDVNAGAQPLYNAEKTMRWPLTARSTPPGAARGVWRSLPVPDRFRLRSDPRAVTFGERPGSSTTSQECSPSPCMTAKDAIIGRDHIGKYPAVYGP